MAKEIERKFTVDMKLWQPDDSGFQVKQGYLPISGKSAVRVRIVGEQAWLSVKGENRGPVRLEFEYRIPVDDAQMIFDEMCERPFIEKTRYLVKHGIHTWEVDVFEGENSGLVIAEIELASEDEAFERPPWVMTEVTHDSRYYNSNLIKYPFKDWPSSC